MIRLLLCICLLWAFVDTHSALLGQNLPSEEVLLDRVLIKVRNPRSYSRFSEPGFAKKSSNGMMERLKDLDDDVKLSPVFRCPPRGWRHPDAAEKIGLERWLIVEFAEARTDIYEISASLEEWSDVEICELDVGGYVAAAVPNDPAFSSQYALQSEKLNAPKAWDIQTDSNHTVAVIDSGADLDHADLVGNLWQNLGEIPNNGIDDDLNGFIDDVIGWDLVDADNTPDDELGHGIHVCGIVGAKADNHLMVAGVCWNVPIMVVRYLDENGWGSQSRAAAGIVYAADNGATVLNNSWGYFTKQQVLVDAVQYSVALDNVIVAAAHNQGSTVEIYPAALDEVMGIIATDEYDNKPSWSNYGSWCDMAAPGDHILSLWLNNGTTYGMGTSMASPHVAGAAALVRAVNPSLDGSGTRWVLQHTSTDLGNKGFDIFFGWGRLDLSAAVEKARSLRSSGNVIPESGGAVSFFLNAGSSHANRTYFLLGSVSGINPGFTLPGTGILPLNWDLFTNLVIKSLNGPVFSDFTGSLDSSGKGTALLNTAGPVPPGLAGTNFHFAYALNGPWNFASNSVKVTIVP